MQFPSRLPRQRSGKKKFKNNNNKKVSVLTDRHKLGFLVACARLLSGRGTTQEWEPLKLCSGLVCLLVILSGNLKTGSQGAEFNTKWLILCLLFLCCSVYVTLCDSSRS